MRARQQDPDATPGTRLLGYSSAFCLLTTGIFFALYAGGPGPAEDPEEALSQITDPGARFYLTYANAALITVSVAATLAGLHRYLTGEGESTSAAGYALIPAYCAMNLFAYGSQLFLPGLLRRSPGAGEAGRLARLVHNYQGSLTSKISAGAYVIVGIPSVTLGAPLLKKGKAGKIAGISLALSAAADAVGFAGAITNNSKIGFGLIVCAFFFLVSLVALSFGRVAPAS